MNTYHLIVNVQHNPGWLYSIFLIMCYYEKTTNYLIMKGLTVYQDSYQII